ncbi:MAG: hypothetical protein JKY53_03720 [Flavobacteriales bacterium]|nr:hypothetical protein [Flavobacteriales bacterium]
MRYFITILSVVVLLFSCQRKKGCTDSTAKNYDWEAKKDDGSCDYSGCTDPDALNYNPNAKEDNGSCSYPGKIRFFGNISDENEYVLYTFNDTMTFVISQNCSSNSDCDAIKSNSCSFVELANLEPATYSYTAIKVRGNDTIVNLPTSYATVTSNGCVVQSL